MTHEPLLLAIDQGTTSTRAMLFDPSGRPVARAQTELPQIYPRPGWVEHDPERIWEDTVAVCRLALEEAGTDASRVAGLGITNQRETTVLWHRATGRPIHHAIVWQDRRTSDLCRRLREEGRETLVQERTGLVVDPYFSATKIAWLLEHVAGAREAADRGELAFGTIDSWLLWRLTGGLHATDVTNAARTMLFDIRALDWDEELLEALGIPRVLLPEVLDTSGVMGETDPALLGGPIPIAGMAGDQQAASFGQAAFRPGMIKSTYGTGCFVLLNTGGEAVRSRHRLLTTVAWRIGGEVTYALEGSIFVAGAAVQWLRDALAVIEAAPETEALAAGLEDTRGVYLVPGFVGLGAPYWDAEARGAILGLTRESGVAHIARAALEAVAYQTRDLMEAMAADGDVEPVALRVDGGLAANDWAMQFVSDMLDLPVERPEVIETTALGAACLAGLAVGVYGSLEDIADNWRLERRWTPSMPADRREALYDGWRRAVRRVLTVERS